MKKIIIIIITFLVITGGILIYYKNTTKEKPKSEPAINLFANKHVNFTSKDIIDNIAKSTLWLKNANLSISNNSFIINYQKENLQVEIIDTAYAVKIDTQKTSSSDFIQLFGALIDTTQYLLGEEFGKYNDTYLKNVSQEIITNGIKVYQQENIIEIYYEFDKLQPIYQVAHTYQFNEFIPLNNLENIAIENPKYKINSLSNGYSPDIEIYSICANVYNNDLTEGNIKIQLYDTNKKLLNSEEINISANKSNQFCTNIKISSSQNQNLKYFQIISI